MPENTSKRDPIIHMLGAMSDGPDGYITGMEADGQRQLVASEQFPTRAPIAELEALGFTFGPVDERDPLFRAATLPAGWKRQASDHSMWSHIVDERGRERVSIFYKAAFYDRAAHAHLVHPTNRLSRQMYADAEPTAVELDDLCTAEVARNYLAKELEHDEEYRAHAAGLDVPTVDYDERIARIRVLQRLVDEAADHR